MLRRTFVAVLPWVVACSYDFAGGSGAGGAGTSVASVSSSDASTQVSSASSTAQATASADVSSSAAQASSSSGGPLLAPCHLVDTPGEVFVETFDDAQAPDRWQQEKDGGNGTASVNATGQVVITLGNSTRVFYASKRAITFVDCYVVVEQIAGSEHAVELAAIRAADDEDTAFVLRYVSNAPADPLAQGHILVDGQLAGPTQFKTTPRRKLLRLETIGNEIHAMVGDDGVSWETIYLGDRLPWMDAPVRLVLGVRTGEDGTSGASSFDNVNTL